MPLSITLLLHYGHFIKKQEKRQVKKHEWLLPSAELWLKEWKYESTWSCLTGVSWAGAEQSLTKRRGSKNIGTESTDVSSLNFPTWYTLTSVESAWVEGVVSAPLLFTPPPFHRALLSSQPRKLLQNKIKCFRTFILSVATLQWDEVISVSKFRFSKKATKIWWNLSIDLKFTI